MSIQYIQEKFVQNWLIMDLTKMTNVILLISFVPLKVVTTNVKKRKGGRQTDFVM